jgi:hypothetical protein
MSEQKRLLRGVEYVASVAGFKIIPTFEPEKI